MVTARELGAIFRSKREEKNLSIKEVESGTSIRAIYLQAIEEGRVGFFLSQTYALGFMKQYAHFLGIDAEQLFKDHAEALKFPTAKQEFVYGIGTLETRGNPHGGVRWGSNVLWGVAFVTLLVVAYFFAKFLGVL